MSQVDGDLSKIEAGPCALIVGGIPVGHTLGGVRLSVKPLLRKRTVDAYGTSTADLVYQGEDIEISTVVVETTATALRLVYQWGYQTTATRQAWGLVRARRGQSLVAELVVRSLADVTDSSNDVVFYAVAVNSITDLEFGKITADRTFGVTFVCLVDTSVEGAVLGEIRINSPVVPGGGFLLSGGGRLLLGSGDALLLGN